MEKAVLVAAFFFDPFWLSQLCRGARRPQSALLFTHLLFALQAAWKTKVVPQIQQLKEKLGHKWQEKAPKIAALLKAKAGAAYEKAAQFINKHAPAPKGAKAPQGPKPKKA